MECQDAHIGVVDHSWCWAWAISCSHCNVVCISILISNKKVYLPSCRNVRFGILGSIFASTILSFTLRFLASCGSWPIGEQLLKLWISCKLLMSLEVLLDARDKLQNGPRICDSQPIGYVNKICFLSALGDGADDTLSVNIPMKR
jgi:hypothetical protein